MSALLPDERRALLDKIAELEEELRQLRQLRQPVAVPLTLSGFTRQETAIMALLLDSEIVPHRAIDACIGHRDAFADPAVGRRVVISNIRRKLKGICIHNKWGIGYWMTREDRERIAAVAEGKGG